MFVTVIGTSSEIILHVHLAARYQILIKPSDAIEDLQARIQDRTGITPDLQKIHYSVDTLYPDDEDKTLDECGLLHDTVIYVTTRHRGGKPVIYSFSPSDIEASVKLSLVPEWSIIAIYPVVPIKLPSTHFNKELTWRVSVHPSGDLTELNTGLDVAYLFWEALCVFFFPCCKGFVKLKHNM